jgi:phosphate starvation-inducible PhoH-like protein
LQIIKSVVKWSATSLLNIFVVTTNLDYNIIMPHRNKVYTLKEAHLSRRKQRAQQSAQQQHYTPHTDNTINFDSYRNHKSKQIHLVPKTLSQETYIDLLTNPEQIIVFATGPAGTGKTMLAVLAALKAYKEGECSKIVITRPAVGVDDEQHGFLPGDLNQKMAPWTRPILDYVAEYYRQPEIAKMLEEQIIEISPLAYMRGRTFKNSWIIADEMQNATPSQMKMLLTRLGEGSKIVVTGDTRQADRREADNGLLDFKRLVDDYKRCKYVAGVEFNGKDVQRHPAVLEILKIYKEV